MHGYTLAQVRAFVAAIDRADRRRRHSAVLDARAAQAPGKTFQAYVKSIEP